MPTKPTPYVPDDRDPGLMETAERIRKRKSGRSGEDSSPQTEAKRIEASLGRAHRKGTA